MFENYDLAITVHINFSIVVVPNWELDDSVTSVQLSITIQTT